MDSLEFQIERLQQNIGELTYCIYHSNAKCDAILMRIRGEMQEELKHLREIQEIKKGL